MDERTLTFLLYRAAERSHATAQQRNGVFPLVGDTWRQLDRQLKRDKARMHRLIAALDELPA